MHHTVTKSQYCGDLERNLIYVCEHPSSQVSDELLESKITRIKLQTRKMRLVKVKPNGAMRFEFSVIFVANPLVF